MKQIKYHSECIKTILLIPPRINTIQPSQITRDDRLDIENVIDLIMYNIKNPIVSPCDIEFLKASFISNLDKLSLAFSIGTAAIKIDNIKNEPIKVKCIRSGQRMSQNIMTEPDLMSVNVLFKIYTYGLPSFHALASPITKFSKEPSIVARRLSFSHDLPPRIPDNENKQIRKHTFKSNKSENIPEPKLVKRKVFNSNTNIADDIDESMKKMTSISEQTYTIDEEPTKSRTINTNKYMYMEIMINQYAVSPEIHEYIIDIVQLFLKSWADTLPLSFYYNGEPTNLESIDSPIEKHNSSNVWTVIFGIPHVAFSVPSLILPNNDIIVPKPSKYSSTFDNPIISPRSQRVVTRDESISVISPRFSSFRVSSPFSDSGSNDSS